MINVTLFYSEHNRQLRQLFAFISNDPGNSVKAYDVLQKR